MDGVELLEAVKKNKPEIPIVMISGHGDGTAINTMRMGAIIFQNTRSQPFVEYGQKRIGQRNLFQRTKF
jgi:FixJ family two-component response regulator